MLVAVQRCAPRRPSCWGIYWFVLGWRFRIGPTFCPACLACTNVSSSQVWHVPNKNICASWCQVFAVHAVPSPCMHLTVLQLACLCTCWQLEYAGHALTKPQPHLCLLPSFLLLSSPSLAPAGPSFTARTQRPTLCPRFFLHSDSASPSP
jgi:hypothetical protein